MVLRLVCAAILLTAARWWLVFLNASTFQHYLVVLVLCLHVEKRNSRNAENVFNLIGNSSGERSFPIDYLAEVRRPHANPVRKILLRHTPFLYLVFEDCSRMCSNQRCCVFISFCHS